MDLMGPKIHFKRGRYILMNFDQDLAPIDRSFVRSSFDAIFMDFRIFLLLTALD